MKDSASKTIDFTKGDMTKSVARFALPLLCANLVQLLYSAADALFAGNVVGTAGIAAIGASSLAVTCVVSFLSGFSVGGNVLIASKRGAQDKVALRQVFSVSVLLALILGVLFCALGLMCSDCLMGVMAVPDSVRDDALSYVRIYFLSLPFVALYDNVASCLRGVGDSKTPLYAQIVGGVANVVLDAVALIVFGLGVDGVAWATFFFSRSSISLCLSSRSGIVGDACCGAYVPLVFQDRERHRRHWVPCRNPSLMRHPF